MYMKQDLKSLGANIVYLKPVDVSDLPQEVQAEAGELTTLFAVHNTKGEQVALVANPQIAAHLAEQHNMRIATLH